ncbi:TonB-dependent hemoglobin/transferrin/lactoferrin family receptor [Aureimonas pseudogalii]|uniref:Hemoglobin/transferrin/lactoferrin receptor protein n=2 Tax=Aureimonas pseudogalii TaxID=1744844 RepID=A0A7W6H8L0_9HYPH|nr:hemoglobin/transferrin/lactoferrin receptor protein [Aureimonas pseudogalii]
MAGVAVSALVVGTFAAPIPALAQVLPDAENADADAVVLDPVVVQGAPAPVSAAKTTTTTTTTRRTIDDKLVDSIADLGRSEEAGVTFNRRTNSLNVRGLEGSRVLTTIDGVRVPYLNDATRGATGGGSSFDFDTLSALDLTRGTAPLAGSGALGGVLALRTLDPEDLLLGGRRIGGLTKNGYDSVDRSWFTSNAAAMRSGDTLVLVQGGYRGGQEFDSMGDRDVLGAARTAPNPSDTKQGNLLAKLHQYVEGGHRFGLVGEIYDRNEDIDGRTTQTATGNYRGSQYFTGEELARRKAALTYDFDAPERGTGWIDEASATLYYQEVERHTTVDAYRSTSVIGPFTRDNSYEEGTYGFNGSASGDYALGATRHRITVGTELRSGTSTQYSAGEDGCPAGPPYPRVFTACNNLHTNQADTPKVDSRAIGFYAQDEVALLDERLRITPGLRFDWYEEKPELTPEYEGSAAFDGSLPASSGDHALSPKLLAEYDLLPELTAYAQWGMGFRAPTAGELYSRFGAVGTYLRVGNEDLDPETSRGFDVGLRAGNADLGGQLNVFHTRYRDFIDTVTLAPPGGEYPQGGITGYRNIPDAEIAGVEVGGHVRFLEGWQARASLAYAQGRNLTDDTYLDSASPLTALFGLGYERRDWGSEVTAKLAARRDKVDEGFVAPGYGVLDVTAWYAPERLPGFKLAGGIFNILDKTYYDAVNVPDSRTQPTLYYSEPGRSFKLNVTYQF